MMQLEVAGKRYPVSTGETVIGSAPEAAIPVSGEGVRPRHAVVQSTSEGTAAIRPAEPGADLLINGVRLGSDPTPVLHGDKIQIAGHEILAVDPGRSGSTQLFDSGAFADLIPRNLAKTAAAAPTAGRPRSSPPGAGDTPRLSPRRSRVPHRGRPPRLRRECVGRCGGERHRGVPPPRRNQDQPR